MADEMENNPGIVSSTLGGRRPIETRALPGVRCSALVSTFMTIINGVEMEDGVDEPNEIVRDCDDEPIQDNPGYKPCNCEDYPCCGH